jgi:single-strand DNA-binding protein
VAGDTVIVVIGNLVDDPGLRYTASGAAVANFTIASTPRVKKGDQWEDGESLFLRCNIWRQPAEHVVESLTKGARVIAQGRLKQRSFETREGEKRTVVELDVDEIGPSLRYATAKVNKVARSGSYENQAVAPPADDPWGSAPPPPAGQRTPSPQGWGSGFNDKPPF